MGSLREKLKKENRLEGLQQGNYSYEINDNGYTQKQAYQRDLVSRVKQRANAILANKQSSNFQNRQSNISNNFSQQMNVNNGGFRSTANKKLASSDVSNKSYTETKNPEKEKNIWNDTKNIVSNFGLGVKKAGESSLSYIEAMSNKSSEYKAHNQFNARLNKEKQELENLKNGKTIEGDEPVQKTRVNTFNDLKLQNQYQRANPILFKAKENSQLESPIKGYLDKKITADEEKIQQNIENSSNKVSRKIAELMPSIAQSVTGLGVSAVNPGLGLAFWQTSAGGDYVRDAKTRGMNDEDALKYGTIMGAMESATEWVGGELTKGVGKAIAKGDTIKGLKALGLDIGENFFEESIMEPLQETVASMTGGKESANWSNIAKRMLQSGIDGALTSIIMGGASVGVGKATQLIGKMQNGEKISQEEIADTLKEINKQEEIDVEKVLVDSFGFGVQNTQNEPVLQNNRQRIQLNNKMAQNGNIEQTTVNEDLRVKIPGSNYKFEASGNQKINNLRQDANKYFNNSEKARNYVGMLEKIITDKNIDIRLDANLKTPDGKIANGSYSNGVITINPNSTKAGEFIAVHELTHAIGTKDMLNMVENYRKSNKEFDNAVQNLLKSYRATELTEEALSDVSAQLFGNQEFINNIAQSNPNIFQRIYSEIKYLWHQFRGYKNQDQFIEDLYYKWTQAYNSNKFDVQKYSYSIQEDSNGGRYVKVDTDQSIFKGKNLKEQTKTAQEYILNNFREKGLLKDNTNINVSRKTANEYTHPKTGIDNTTYSSKMKASTELDNLLEISRYIKSEQDDGRHIFAKDGWDYYETVFKVGDKTYSGWLNIANGKNGKLLYDITNIKERASNYSVKTVSVANSSINNSIPSSNKDVNTTTKYSIQESEKNSDSFNLQKNKERQLEIIQKTNPMQDDYHVGIRSVDDIKTFEEIIDGEESFVYGDFSQEDAKKALERGKVTVYSSKPIKQGGFVSTSKNMAQDYAGNGQVYSQEVKLNDVAWINGDEGQYAKIDNEQYSKNNPEWQEYLESNFKSEGTRTYNKDIRLLEQARMPEQAVLKSNISNAVETKGEKETEEKIAQILTTPQAKQKESDRKWAILGANILDKGLVFENLSKRTKNRELEAKWDYTLSSQSRAQNAIGNSRYEFDGRNKKQISKGLTEIIDEVGDSVNDFQNYMYHQLNIDRMTLNERFGIENKPVFGKNIGATFSRTQVAEYEKNNPKFKEWAQDVYDYTNADKAELVKNGVISQELSDKFAEMYPHYIPIKRINTKGNAINVPLDTRRTGVNSPIKKAKGGNKDINPLFETMAERTMQTYRASARNSLGIELKNTLAKINELQTNETEQLDLDNIVETINNDESSKELLQEGKNGQNPTFTVFENGEKVTFDINKDIYDALKIKDDSSLLSKTFKLPNKVSNLRRSVLTEYNPVFLVTNAIKDSQDVLINSQHAGKTYSKFPEAYAQIVSKGYWYNEYVQNGGGQNTYFKDGEFEKVKTGVLPGAKNVITIPFKAISKVNNVIEMAPRLAEYIASREQGRSIQTSMLDASRVTTNFKAGGDVTKFLNRNGVTFLNAGVQGTMQAVRNVREANAQGLKGWAILACKTAIAGAPAIILNNLIWGDDEDYEELQDYVKDSYYIVAKKGDGEFIRIPKGRTVSVIQKVVSNVDKYLNNKQELNIDNISKDIWETLKFAVDNIAPNNPIDNNVASPIVQVATNTSWYGDEIVPERLQSVPKAEQYDETTDEFSKWVGKTLNVSPMKVNYLLDQYGGGVSDVLLPMGTPQAENNVVEDKFTTDSTMKSRYPGEFFEKIDKLEINKNSSKATDKDVLKYKYMASISEEMSELYKKKREIQNAYLTDNEKKKQLKSVQKDINSLAKNGLNTVEKIKTTNTTAVIGDKQYYKQVDEWKVLTDEEKEKNKNISLETYSDYKTKLKTTTEQKKLKLNDDEASLSDIEKMEILKGSSYSLKERDALYSNYIMRKSDNKVTEYEELKEYYANNSTLGAKNQRSYEIIDEYLDYKVKSSEKLKELKASGKVSEKSNSLSAEEATKLLANSKYTNVKTEALYVSVVASDTNKAKYEIVKQMNGGGNKINTYLDYVLADKGADKEDDGTKNGKSISGTKKIKVFNVIDNMKINRISQIYLHGTEYDLNTSNELDSYYELKNYISKLSKAEQLKIVKTLKGSVEMKNGSYRW